MTSILKRALAVVLIVCGVSAMLGILFFYGVVLFSDKWSALKDTQEALKLTFGIRSGLLVMYASFATLYIPAFLVTLYGAFLLTGREYVSKVQVVFLLGVWFIAVALGFFTTILQVQSLIEKVSPFSDGEAPFDVESQIPLSTQFVFKTTLKNEVVRTQGVPIEGYTPDMFLRAFLGLTDTDFEGVEASVGHYTIENGTLTHKLDAEKLIHSAAGAVTDRGLDTLLANVSVRLGVDLTKDGTLTQIMNALVMPHDAASAPPVSSGVTPGSTGGGVPYTPPSTIPDGGGMIACTMDAKICPDGSAVGRTGPKCEFAPCPGAVETTHVCTEAERGKACTREYAPVCGLVAIQCITTPCNPVPETFGNDCSACSDGRVISYTEGACAL